MALRWLLVFTTLLLSQTAAFAVENAYLAGLIAKSRQLHLADRPEWLKLMHYVPNLVAPGLHGLVDSPQFYNASDGKYNPQSELEATLASFYSEIEETDKQQNPQCLFIARYTWLNENLSFDPHRLPHRECRRYQQWRNALNPSGLTLIFASAYMNSPSSMYGHPLLRVDAQDQDEHTRLLAYAVTFAANTDESNGIVFAVNGLFGGYPGTFSILPYYLKVREYSNLENRDIWEYQLDLSPAEIERVLQHAWEMGPTYFQYYFFDENCAYHLLGLLQVARPELDLTGQFRWWAIPADIVRAIEDQPGMVRKVIYRPASATMVQYRLDGLQETERTLVQELNYGHLAPSAIALQALTQDRKAAVLETSQDYVGYRRAIGKQDVPDPAALARELLTARSQLDIASPALAIPPPTTHPGQGHGSARATVGGGRRDGINFQQLSIRASYHDILDSDEGYARGAQIEFFSVGMRHYAADATRIEQFVPVNILSLTPRDRFFQSLSWKIAAGWQRVLTPAGSEPLVFVLEGGAGGAWSNRDNTALWYALFDVGTSLHDDLEKGYALGAGTSAGALLDLNPAWRIHGYLHGIRYFMGQLDTPYRIGLEQRVALGRDRGLRIDFSRNSELQHRYNSGAITLLLYF